MSFHEAPPVVCGRPPPSPISIYGMRTSSIPTPRRATNPSTPSSAPIRSTPWNYLDSFDSPVAPALASQIPQSRFRKASHGELSSSLYNSGTSSSIRFNKELPLNPDALQSTPRASGIPVKIRNVVSVAENSPRLPYQYQSDSVLNLPDGHRRSINLGISGPTIRFSKDCDEGIMGTDEIPKVSKGRKWKTEQEIAASFRSNRTSDSMLADRLVRPTKTTTPRSPEIPLPRPEVKPEGLKSRMSAMLTRRPRGPTASTINSKVSRGTKSTSPRVPDPVPTSLHAPTPVRPIRVESLTLDTAPNVFRSSDELFKAGLRQVNIALDTLAQIAAVTAPDEDKASDLRAKVCDIVNRVHHINEMRVARIDLSNHLDGLAVAEAVGVNEAVNELNQLIADQRNRS